VKLFQNNYISHPTTV